MESVKDKSCNTCYWSSLDGLDFANPCGRCKECSDESSINNPYPKWTSKAPTVDIKKPEAIWNVPQVDMVNQPPHYTAHPSGVECIQITEHMNFCLGNAVKYLWRAGDKHETPLEDLKKARWYIDREIQRLEKE